MPTRDDWTQQRPTEPGHYWCFEDNEVIYVMYWKLSYTDREGFEIMGSDEGYLPSVRAWFKPAHTPDFEKPTE